MWEGGLRGQERDHLSRASPQVLDGQEGGERGAIE